MRDAEGVAAAAGVRENLPLIVVGHAAVGDVLGGGRAGARGDVDPGAAIPLLEVEVKVGAGSRSDQFPGVRTGNGRLIPGAIRLDLRRSGAAERSAVRRALRSRRSAVGRVERDAGVRRVTIEADVP